MLDALRRWWTGGERPAGPVVVARPDIPPPSSDFIGAATLPGRFDACLPVILRHEGGYVDHPRDPGGCTNWGITRATLEEWRVRPTTCGDVRALTTKEAGDIYRARYWRAVQADALPPGVDLMVFDGAVNSGPGQSIRWLQRAVSVADDGRIGPVTLAAVARHSPGGMIFAIAGARMAFLRRLSAWGTFGRGWERRVMDVQAEALRMAKVRPPR